MSLDFPADPKDRLDFACKERVSCESRATSSGPDHSFLMAYTLRPSTTTPPTIFLVVSLSSESMADVRFSLLDLARVIDMALLPKFASCSGGGDEINEKQRFYTK